MSPNKLHLPPTVAFNLFITVYVEWTRQYREKVAWSTDDFLLSIQSMGKSKCINKDQVKHINIIKNVVLRCK